MQISNADFCFNPDYALELIFEKQPYFYLIKKQNNLLTLTLSILVFRILLIINILQNLRHHFWCRIEIFCNFALCMYAKNQTGQVAQVLLWSQKN